MGKDRLSQEDVSKLLSDRSVDMRVETAAKLAAEFEDGGLSESERRVAEDILRLMARDAEVQVREALAVNLKESAALPHDVAVALAQDVERVALPILQFSKVLNDADLIEIVRGQNVVKQVAIARRAEVSAAVSEVLADTRNQEVVGSLVANEGADISEAVLRKVERDFRGEPSVQGSLKKRTRVPPTVAAAMMGMDGALQLQRPQPPVTVAERLVTLVSQQFEEQLVSRHRLAEDVAADIMTQSRERATITLFAGASRDDVEGLVRHLRVNGRLTGSIMLRAVCVGDMAFFEAGMAELAGIPLGNAQALIHDGGRRGLPALYEKAGLPASMFPAFRCAIDVADEMQFDGEQGDRERYCRRMVERVLTQYEKLGVTFEAPDLEYLLARISHLPEAAEA